MNKHTKYLQVLKVNPCSLKNRETIACFNNAGSSVAELLQKKKDSWPIILLLFIVPKVIYNRKE